MWINANIYSIISKKEKYLENSFMDRNYNVSDSDKKRNNGTIVHSDGNGSSIRGNTFSDSHNIVTGTHRIQESNSTRKPPKGR